MKCTKCEKRNTSAQNIRHSPTRKGWMRKTEGGGSMQRTIKLNMKSYQQQKAKKILTKEEKIKHIQDMAKRMKIKLEG